MVHKTNARPSLTYDLNSCIKILSFSIKHYYRLVKKEMYHYTTKSALSELSLHSKERINRLGYWLVDDDKIFFNKIQALCYCTETKTTDIKYQVEPEKFNSANWDIEPTQSLQELYQQRAVQLREKYDYLVLCYSSGSDSVTALNSFLQVGIRPDEVVTYVVDHPTIDKMCNANIEFYKNYDYINNLCKKHNLKLTTLNFYNNYEFYNTPNWIYQSHGIRSPHSNAQGLLAHSSYFQNKINQGLKCALVYGLDKPNICLDESNNFCSYLMDHPLNTYTDLKMYSEDYNGMQIERFFVSGDLPELTIKQSHTVARHYREYADVKNFLTFGKHYKPADYKNTCIKLLYPEFNPDDFFTIGKKFNDIKGYRDEWFWKLPSTNIWQKNVTTAWKSIEQKIDNRWFNDGLIYNDTVGCVSDFYRLGITVSA